MTSGHVLHSGWLRKSPPEEKLRLFAWRKRWFILRKGQTSSDPDVLEYYKNDGSKNPLRTINLNLCEQLDVGVTLDFNKKEIQKGYMFDIKTNERTFYLVAETREDMNKWVQSICQICGFRQIEESTAEPSCSHQHLPQEREPTSEPPVSHRVRPTRPIPAPRGCLCSHQHASQKAGHASHTFDSSSSQHPIPMQSIMSTDSEDIGERDIFLPSIGPVTSGEKVDYVQVDLEKTWALQKTMHEQMRLRQSLEPPRGAKL
ncbi:hypothetical protein H8958_001464 [Nasalis larvatus]